MKLTNSCSSGESINKNTKKNKCKSLLINQIKEIISVFNSYGKNLYPYNHLEQMKHRVSKK